LFTVSVLPLDQAALDYEERVRVDLAGEHHLVSLGDTVDHRLSVFEDDLDRRRGKVGGHQREDDRGDRHEDQVDLLPLAEVFLERRDHDGFPFVPRVLGAVGTMNWLVTVKWSGKSPTAFLVPRSASAPLV